MVSEKIVISPTPVILSYFAEKEKGTRQKVTKAVFEVAKKMEDTNLYMDAVFRGYLQSPGPVTSETVDNELWYWFSNDFLKKCNESDNNDLCLEKNCEKPITKKLFKEYEIKNLHKNLRKINWGDDSNRIQFIKILSEVLPSAD